MESISELKRLIDKGKTRRPRSAMFYIEPIQVYVTKVLLLLKFNSISATLLWLFTGVLGAIFFLPGNVLYGFIAIGLFYFSTVLDGCDGQIARYYKHKISEEEDFKLWAYGLYLDKNQHILNDTLAMSFFAFGLYRINDNPIVLISGAILVYLRIYKRTQQLFIYRISSFLRKKKNIFENIEFKDLSSSKNRLPIRIIDSLFFWIKNGKFLYLLILAAHILDTICPLIGISLGELNFRIILLFSLSVIGLIGVIKEMVFDVGYGEILERLKRHM